MNTTFTQLTDILQRIKGVHREVGAVFDQARNGRTERSLMLVDFFCQREEELACFLDSLQRERDDEFFDTWVQFAGTEEVEAALVAVHRAGQEEIDELIGKTLDLHEQIVNLLGRLTDGWKTSNGRDQLASVAEFEHKAAKDLSTAVTMHGET
jgi:hypothetical protein